MSIYATSYTKRRMSLKEAFTRHTPLRKAITVMAKGRKRQVVARAADEAWRAMCGIPHNNPGSIFSSVLYTMPVEYAGFMWLADGIPAVFAMRLMAQHLDGVDLSDDFLVRQQLLKVWADFEKMRRSASTIERGFGCDSSEAWIRFQDIVNDGSFENDQEFQDRMIEIANLAGKMLEDMGYTQSTVPNDDPHSVKGVTTGGDLARLTAPEIGALGNADHEDMATMRLLTDQAQQTEPEGSETQTRGEFVLVVDESGSMADGYGYGQAKFVRGRNTWAKACCMALTRIAWSEGRDVRVVHFSRSTLVHDVPKDDSRAMFEMARTFLDGGTSFVQGLTVAEEQLTDLENCGRPGADIVFISDGYCYNSEIPKLTQFCDRMDKRDVDLWTIAIGQGWDKDFVLRKRAKKYVHANDKALKHLKTASDLAKGLEDSAKASLAN